MSGIAMLGAGSFGTAVAAGLARAGNEVLLLCRTPEQAAAIDASGENARFFPGHPLPAGIRATADLDRALAAETLFLAFPAKAMEDYVDRIAAGARPGTTVVNLVKGLHAEHFSFADLFAARAPAMRYVALKGPTFARPLFLGEWSGLTCGADDPADAARVVAMFGDEPIAFDVVPSAMSVDVASALKNIYAIALGLVGSTGPSDNTVYMAVTLVLQEVDRILAALGCHPDVLLSFAGVGDTLLTGLCDTSRNRTLGLMMGKGIPLELVRADFLAEGVRAAEALEAHLSGISAPILHMVAEVLHGRAAPSALFDAFGLA